MKTIFNLVSLFIFILGCDWLFKKTNFPNKLIRDSIKNYKYFKLIIILMLAAWLWLMIIVTDSSIFAKHYYIKGIVYAMFFGIGSGITTNLIYTKGHEKKY